VRGPDLHKKNRASPIVNGGFELDMSEYNTLVHEYDKKLIAGKHEKRDCVSYRHTIQRDESTLKQKFLEVGKN
jgi:hypothetical protein